MAAVFTINGGTALQITALATLLSPWRLHDAMRFRRGLPWADPLGQTLRTDEVGVSRVVGVLRRLIGR